MKKTFKTVKEFNDWFKYKYYGVNETIIKIEVTLKKLKLI